MRFSIRLAHVLRACAEALEMGDTDESTCDYPLPPNPQQPEPLSSPIDVQGMWRSTSADYAAWSEDDEWRQGQYI